MKYFVMTLLLIIFLGAGCLSLEASVENAEVDIAKREPATDGVVVQNGSTPSGQGVYEHSVWLARSADGETWSLEDEVLIEHASVPNVTRFEMAVGNFPAGTLMIVYVDATEMATGENGTERTGRYVSMDGGETWKDIGPVTYVGADGHVLVDPNLVQLPDGTLRMYYFDFSQNAGGVVVAEEGGTSRFYAADSTDGETFTVVGEVFSGDRLTDPEVVFYNDKSYLFYASQSQDDSGIRVAVGDEEALSFTQINIDGDLEGIPGAIVVENELRVFGCVMSEGIAYYTADESLEFGDPTSLGNDFKGGFCDPDPVQLEDGSYLLVVKKLPEPTRR